MPRSDIPKPSYATKNMRIIGHTEQNGRGDGQQIMVRKGYAFVGHVCSKGFSVVDVRDPTKPKTVNYIQNPPNTWSLHLQVHDDLLLLVHGRDMFSQPENGGRAELLQAEGWAPRRAFNSKDTELVGGYGSVRYLKAGRAAADRFHAGRGNRPASYLVRFKNREPVHPLS